MNVDVALLPSSLGSHEIKQRAVVVFDVLRATTTLAAALSQGVEEIRVFPDLDSARHAAAAHGAPRLLCGEHRCLPPEGFDLGNSPVAFDRALHSGQTMFLSTTNGTRAFLAARAAKILMAGAIVNAAAVARMLEQAALDVTLLCAGTDGQLALEDIVGAGAVIEALTKRSRPHLRSDAARLAWSVYRCRRDHLLETLRDSQGGRNILAVGLEADIAYAARLDSIDLVGIVERADADCLTIRPARDLARAL